MANTAARTSPPRRMSREDRREFLIDAGATVLRRRGLAGLSFEAVAEVADVSKTLPYSYFDSPDDIAVELFDRVVGASDRRVNEIVAGAEGFDAKLAASISTWCDIIEDDPRLVQVLLDGRANDTIRPLINQRDADSLALWQHELEAEFGMSPHDAELVATSLTTSVTAVLQLWWRRRLDRTDMIDRFIRLAHAAAAEFAPR